MVSRHGKLCLLFLDLEVGELVLQREFVPEADAVVIHAETDFHDGALAVRIAQVGRIFRIRGAHAHLCGAGGLGLLLKGDQHLVVVVANLCLFSPDGLPGFVQAVFFNAGNGETGKEVFSVQELESQAGRLYHHLFPAAQGIHGASLGSDSHREFQNAAGALDFLYFFKGEGRRSSAAAHQKGRCQKGKRKVFHIKVYRLNSTIRALLGAMDRPSLRVTASPVTTSVPETGPCTTSR